MSVITECREAAVQGATLRVDELLARWPADGAAALQPLAQLIAERGRRLSDHILDGVQGSGDARSVKLSEDSLRQLEGDLQRLSVRPGKAELCALAARHIESALTRTLANPRVSHPQDPFATQQGDIEATEMATKLAAGDPTVDPGQLETWLEVERCVSRLAPQLRQIVDLLFFVGLSGTAAAELLGIPIETVMERWRSAKIRLALAGANLDPN